MNKGQELRIYVKNDKDKVVGISVNENDSIATLKQKTKLALGIGDDTNIEIYYDGGILTDENEKTSSPYKISDYEIENDNFINIFILTKQEIDFENNADNDKMDENDTNKDGKSNLHQNLNISSSRLKNNDLNLINKNFRCKTYTNEDKKEKLKVEKIKVSQEITVYIKTLNAKLISIKIKPNATFKQFLKQAIQDQELSEVHHCKFCFNGKYLLNTGLDLSLSEHKIENGSTIHMQSAQSTSDKSTIWNLKNLEDQTVDNDITLTIWTYSHGKEVTKLIVKKTTTMRDIKKQLQQKYNLSDERINELTLWYSSSDIFYDLDKMVYQVFDKENIEKREVKAYAKNFDFNLKTSEKEIEIDNKSESDNKNDRNKNGIKVNWKLIILIILGLLFFIGAVLAWYLEASCFLIGGLVVAGVVFFSLSFMWPKLKSCIGCIKIGVSKRTEEEDINSLSKSKSELPVVSNDESYLDK